MDDIDIIKLKCDCGNEFTLNVGGVGTWQIQGEFVRVTCLNCHAAWTQDLSNIIKMESKPEAEVTTFYIEGINMVKTLAEAGTICEVFGHWWEVDPLLGHDKTHLRVCRLCGKRQRGKDSVNWVDQ